MNEVVNEQDTQSQKKLVKLQLTRLDSIVVGHSRLGHYNGSQHTVAKR